MGRVEGKCNSVMEEKSEQTNAGGKAECKFRIFSVLHTFNFIFLLQV